MPPKPKNCIANLIVLEASLFIDRKILISSKIMDNPVINQVLIGWLLINTVIADDETLTEREKKSALELISPGSSNKLLLEEEAQRRIGARKAAAEIWKVSSVEPLLGIVRRLRSSTNDDKLGTWTKMRDNYAAMQAKAQDAGVYDAIEAVSSK